MKTIVSHPTSNQVNRAMTYGLNEAQLLHSFHTSVACFPNDFLDRLGNLKPFKEIKKRKFESSLQSCTYSHPYKELMRMALPKLGLDRLTRNEKAPFSIWSVYQNFDKKVASRLSKDVKNGAQAIYAYEDGAYHSFVEAKKLGLSCFYDQPIGYWRAAQRMFQEEREKWPEWEKTMPGVHNSKEKLLNKDNELKLADCVFAASTFTANTLKEYPGKIKQIKVIPFGFPEIYKEKEFRPIKQNQKLKLLFVGGLSQRKGIANLFTAVNKFSKHVSLTVVGRKPNNDCDALNQELSKHNYIPSLPFNDILELMREHDIFVFPSLFEGFGLVITEAMSQGLPVITTANTAGGDLIDHGKNGWLVEPGSTEALEIIFADLIQNPAQILPVAQEAMKTAQGRQWSVYAEEVNDAIANFKQ
ncbi:glycosyltransferase family 4 protein [Zobellia galactanivorans]|uniref:glycosyltransferase family 4 protein n=1 Tax=Zobellia galactanivorans (strain DSM 12802 / CCUG 47099 / CIP 106680 / NCIMB 13871 / Dsij) TaxID=63186 RepID=UPI001C07BE26|nr:glycosyltransferase family 4 protein [Zobellia galactanivorans]MBU3028349.1 glycosyltransferase family 4 protein [Zobellia galactanivorans]